VNLAWATTESRRRGDLLELLISLVGALPWAVIGWPLVAAAVVAFGVAFRTRRARVGFAGAVIAAPLCLYLMDMPYLYWASRVGVVANFVSVAALWRGRRDIAFAMLLPSMTMVVLAVILWYRNFSVFSGYRF
jgi:uncharacterized membrane protein YfcA